MIYVTSDLHMPTDTRKLNMKNFPAQKTLSAADYVIICGDFGGMWDLSNSDLYWLDWLNKKNFTTLFIDGNHDNHDLLNSAFKIVDFCGGKAHKISDKIYHLMRGELFTIDGKTIFTMGGAASHDKEGRTEGQSWWAGELPSPDDYANADKNLARCNYTVDYVITHCAATVFQRKIAPTYPINELTEYFEALRHKLTYQKWYFGHYHRNRTMTEKDILIYDDIVLLGETLHEKTAPESLRLVLPTACYKEKILAYKADFLEHGDSMDGTAGLSTAENFEAWYAAWRDNLSADTVREGLVPATTFLAVDAADNLLGMIDIRHHLNEHLLQFGGHIGYSVLREHRRKGVASKMLSLALLECQTLGIENVLITCNKYNVASAKTILNNGGILENEVPNGDKITKRYWIYL